ncbi:hypothetical protein [Streptomyces rhizosphaerihabitans]|uniref:hypothetical protein n=1 Tax=Streptomyces rhizosphaerihabitans TaxID=1266770 RepID=UPI0021BE9C6C|nr:hypothetical protein [Streptomyces rhizosphaerihabitans]MCT9011749.1 hypothetical protein [Streptomyces rhizosphaerihabitans]
MAPTRPAPRAGQPTTTRPTTTRPTATGTPATGTPATGTPATGTPATGTPATGTPGPAEGAAQYAAQYWPAEQYAVCLEVLLGDPRDRGNPYGRFALWTAGHDALPPPPPGLPAAGQGRPALPTGQLARALRPLLRRDLALAHAWSIRPLLSAPLPHPAAELLGPAALLASAGGVLRGTARIVDGLSRHEPAARQWRPVLAAVFADLLACEALTAMALRSCPDPAAPDPAGALGLDPDADADPALSADPAAALGAGLDLGADADPALGVGVGVGVGVGTDLDLDLGADLGAVPNPVTGAGVGTLPGPGVGVGGPGSQGPCLPCSPRRAGELLAAVVGYLVPQLVGELLGDLELVLNECGFGGDSLERRMLDKLSGDRVFARVDWRAAGAAQARIVRGLNAAGGSWPGGDTEYAALFRVAEPAVSVAPGTEGLRDVAAAPPGATGGLAGAGGPGTVALARLGRRLVTEQRALHTACAATVVHDPADPAARALADRQALLVLAAVVLGVREAAAGAGLPPYLGTAGWALLALKRITGRLALASSGHMPDPQRGVWDELARRAAGGVDCDLYATRLPW